MEIISKFGIYLLKKKMSELINKVNCPNGCINPIFTESVKTIVENNSRLLNESSNGIPSTKKVKIYNCGCCGQTFELHSPSNKKLLI